MGKIVKVSGPLVVATGMEEANMADVVRVGEQRLIGEILNMTGGDASIQVYEETAGLGPGAEVVTTGAPLSVELGPGLIETIYDGIQRPLEAIREKSGSNNLPRGVEVPALDREKLWQFTAVAKPGVQLTGGDVLGTVQETESILHKIMLPPGMEGTLVSIESGSFTVTQTIAVLKKADGSLVELPMMQKWPVRVGRPYRRKYPPHSPLQSGQRIVDTFFPVAHSGALRFRQDGDAACAGQMVGCGPGCLHRLRRARQRDDRRAARVSRTGRPAHRAIFDEAHSADRQHLRHAGGCP